MQRHLTIPDALANFANTLAHSLVTASSQRNRRQEWLKPGTVTSGSGKASYPQISTVSRHCNCSTISRRQYLRTEGLPSLNYCRTWVTKHRSLSDGDYCKTRLSSRDESLGGGAFTSVVRHLNNVG